MLRSGSRFASEWLQSCSRNQVYVHIWHHVGYTARLHSCSRKEVCVHVWHHVGYGKCSGMAPELFHKSSVCSYMALCGVYGKCSGVASDLIKSGSRVAPKIKFVSIYDTMCGIL